MSEAKNKKLVPIIKTNFQGDIRRFSELCYELDPSTMNFDELVGTFRSNYRNLPQNLQIYYIDDEGDKVTVANISDFVEALESVGTPKDGRKILKLFLEAAKDPLPSQSQKEKKDEKKKKNIKFLKLLRIVLLLKHLFIHHYPNNQHLLLLLLLLRLQVQLLHLFGIPCFLTFLFLHLLQLLQLQLLLAPPTLI